MDAVVKRLMKRDRTLTQEQAEVMAQRMWENYCLVNKDALAARNEKYRQDFEKALDWEFLNLEIAAEEAKHNE